MKNGNESARGIWRERGRDIRLRKGTRSWGDPRKRKEEKTDTQRRNQSIIKTSAGARRKKRKSPGCSQPNQGQRGKSNQVKLRGERRAVSPEHLEGIEFN